jgi:hypothetical protein
MTGKKGERKRTGQSLKKNSIVSQPSPCKNCLNNNGEKRVETVQ